MRSHVEELERSLEQHRRALRREVTTRVKVGLDYGDFRGGRHVGSDGSVVGSEHAHHRAPLFPQEVLQAVVRGAVDQSVECALGTGHGGPVGHGAALVDRATGAAGTDASGTNARAVSPGPRFPRVDDDADSAQTSPVASPPYPAPFVPAFRISTPDAGATQLAGGDAVEPVRAARRRESRRTAVALYSMVRTRCERGSARRGFCVSRYVFSVSIVSRITSPTPSISL